MLNKMKRMIAVLCATFVVSIGVSVTTQSASASMGLEYEVNSSQTVPTITQKQADSGAIIYPNEPTVTMITNMECSVWYKPNTNIQENRVKKVPQDYQVTVYAKRFISPYDGKTYYQTIKGKFILAKCLSATQGSAVKTVGGKQMYVWGYSSNGTEIYEDVNLMGKAGCGWPDYMVAVINNCGVTPQMSDYDKAVTLARYLAGYISYDYYSQFGWSDYTTEGALKNRSVVCSGYANAYSNLLYMLGIESYYVRGTANGGSHGWNKVVINGVEYYTDVTWNSCLRSDRYMMITFEQMSADHYYKENCGRTYADEW